MKKKKQYGAEFPFLYVLCNVLIDSSMKVSQMDIISCQAYRMCFMRNIDQWSDIIVIIFKIEKSLRNTAWSQSSYKPILIPHFCVFRINNL